MSDCSSWRQQNPGAQEEGQTRPGPRRGLGCCGHRPVVPSGLWALGSVAHRPVLALHFGRALPDSIDLRVEGGRWACFSCISPGGPDWCRWTPEACGSWLVGSGAAVAPPLMAPPRTLEAPDVPASDSHAGDTWHGIGGEPPEQCPLRNAAALV